MQSLDIYISQVSGFTPKMKSIIEVKYCMQKKKGKTIHIPQGLYTKA